jgi:hypothetical protein
MMHAVPGTFCGGGAASKTSAAFVDSHAVTVQGVSWAMRCGKRERERERKRKTREREKEG